MTIPLSVADRMQTMITAWEGTADRRAIFLSCYALMTRNMLLAIERGEFENGAWVSALLHRFAGYYFSAVEAYDERERCTAVRHFTFEAAREPATHVLQNLILGVNAHINYDLVLALVDLLQEEWACRPRGASSATRITTG